MSPEGANNEMELHALRFVCGTSSQPAKLNLTRHPHLPSLLPCVFASSFPGPLKTRSGALPGNDQPATRRAPTRQMSECEGQDWQTVTPLWRNQVLCKMEDDPSKLQQLLRCRPRTFNRPQYCGQFEFRLQSDVVKIPCCCCNRKTKYTDTVHNRLRSVSILVQP